MLPTAEDRAPAQLNNHQLPVGGFPSAHRHLLDQAVPEPGLLPDQEIGYMRSRLRSYPPLRDSIDQGSYKPQNKAGSTVLLPGSPLAHRQNVLTADRCFLCRCSTLNSWGPSPSSSQSTVLLPHSPEEKRKPGQY